MRNSTFPKELSRVGIDYRRGDSISPRKTGVTNIRTFIREGEEQIQTNTYTFTFNQLHTPKNVNICYCLESSSMSQCPWGASNAKNLDTTGKPVEDDACAKCSEKDPDHLEEDCLKEIRCTNCQQDRLTCIRSCNVYKKRRYSR